MKHHSKMKLKQLNIAVLGARGHGKTSVVNWLTGTQYLIMKEKPLEGGVQGEKDMDTYFTTMKRQHYYIYHKQYHVNIFDLPADQDLTRIKNVMCIQNILFVVSARANDFELASAEIKHILIQCEMLNVKRIIFVINFMDHWPSCNWNQQVYLALVDDLKTMCDSMFKYKKESLQVSFCPTSGLQGENILKKSAVDILIEQGVGKWVADEKINYLLKTIEIEMISKGKTKTQRETKFLMKKRPLRFSVLGTIPRDMSEFQESHNDSPKALQLLEDYELDEENVLGVFAYVHSGKIRRDTKILMQPSQCFTVVKRVEFFTPFQLQQHKRVAELFEDQDESQQLNVPSHASAGSLCFIYFHNKERIKVPLGTIGGVPLFKKIPLEADSVMVRLKVIHPVAKMMLCVDYTALCGMQQFKVKVFEVQAAYSAKLGRVPLQPHQFDRQTPINNKMVYQVRMSVVGNACLEKFAFIPSCGQIFIFDHLGAILAVARVEDLGLKFNSLDHLPRVFAVPKDQIVDPQSKLHRDDWNLCQVDLMSTLNTLCLPCGHIKMCDKCTAKVSRCPFCKIQVHSTRKMQAIEMEDNVDLMEFAKCDQCQKNRISHAVMDCEHYQCFCEDCVEVTKDEPECRLCKKVHLIVKIFI